MLWNKINIIIHVLIAVNIHLSYTCPQNGASEAKAVYKSGEIQDQTLPLNLDKIKFKLKQSEVFDWEDPSLSDIEKKEMTKLFDAVEIMLKSRYRQPASAQSIISSLRVVERVVKKQLKEGQISESLAARFKWDKLSNRVKRASPSYHFDKTTNMRIFNIN